MIYYNVQAMEATEKSRKQAKSPKQAPMEISNDKHDEELLKLNEDELRELQKVDSI